MSQEVTQPPLDLNDGASTAARFGIVYQGNAVLIVAELYFEDF